MFWGIVVTLIVIGLIAIIAAAVSKSSDCGRCCCETMKATDQLIDGLAPEERREDCGFCCR